MVRNDKGGKGAKGLARKAVTGNRHDFLQLSSCSAEKYACVTKMFGNGMCEIITNDNLRLIGHIRSKFRGRQKRSNMITLFSIVLVGLHEWESVPKNCDILCIYDDIQMDQLKNLPQVNITNVLQIKLTNTTFATSNKDVAIQDDVEFTTDLDENEKVNTNKDDTEDFELITETEINIDDI